MVCGCCGGPRPPEAGAAVRRWRARGQQLRGTRVTRRADWAWRDLQLPARLAPCPRAFGRHPVQRRGFSLQQAGRRAQPSTAAEPWRVRGGGVAQCPRARARARTCQRPQAARLCSRWQSSLDCLLAREGAAASPRQPACSSAAHAPPRAPTPTCREPPGAGASPAVGSVAATQPHSRRLRPPSEAPQPMSSRWGLHPR